MTVAYVILDRDKVTPTIVRARPVQLPSQPKAHDRKRDAAKKQEVGSPVKKRKVIR